MLTRLQPPFRHPEPSGVPAAVGCPGRVGDSLCRAAVACAHADPGFEAWDAATLLISALVTHAERHRPPPCLRDWLQALRPCLTAPSWEHVLVMVMGGVLAPGKRIVTACLQMTGRVGVGHFASYHQILNRARWNPRAAAHRLLLLLVERLVPEGPVVIGMDDTIERRWGRRIAPRGIYRDPVRSSHGHFVKTSGLSWLSFMVLTPLPWTSMTRALPVLRLLGASKRADRQRGRRPSC